MELSPRAHRDGRITPSYPVARPAPPLTIQQASRIGPHELPCYIYSALELSEVTLKFHHVVIVHGGTSGCSNNNDIKTDSKRASFNAAFPVTKKLEQGWPSCRLIILVARGHPDELPTLTLVFIQSLAEWRCCFLRIHLRSTLTTPYSVLLHPKTRG